MGGGGENKIPTKKQIAKFYNLQIFRTTGLPNHSQIDQ